MKNLFYILIGSLLLTAAGCSQTKPDGDPMVIGIAASRLIEVTQDTLNSAGALDTVNFTIGSYFGSPTAYDVQVSADSISGATAGNAILQWSAAPSGTDWYNISTTVINGTQTRARLTGDILGGRLRLHVLAPDTATQVTTIRVDGQFSGSEPTQ